MKNRICNILGIEKPVIQGPMVWLTDAKLAAAVSNAGGLGSLGPNAGQTSVTRDPGETAERMRAEIRKVRELTDKPFSVNVLPMSNGVDVFTPPMLKVIFEEKVPVVTYVGDVKKELFDEIKSRGIKIVYRSLNPSPAEAAFAEECGADIVVATGFDEGGTLPNMTLGTFSIVPLIVDAVKSVPVMAAGGIYDRRSFNAALALGAEGVYCGTAFLMSEESRMAANVKEAVLKANAKDLLLFRTIPAYYRSLPGALANKLVEMDRAGATNEELGKAMGGFANLRKGMLEGDMENGYVSVGHAISFIHEIKPAAQIIADMTRDWGRLA
ncbi:MAG: nitronate monooxygenase [Lentisphaerae bacterium]|nr:nitronate monooxygenase [Lentisphaerota bacterium]